ncbi:MAG: NAD(P)-dependent glycerol-1-phosphate dehydrogenase [Thermoplasmata archaeon]|nr:MAG: NAD(P)-dependent glycerol-1-phosphate dehydrogenase [Thermoplasmata archaeon]
MNETFTKSKTTELPRIIMVGHEVINEVGNVCIRLHLEKPGLIISDEITKKIAGEKVEQILSDNGLDVHQMMITDANSDNISQVKDQIKELKANFVLGVGGGRPIDVAKCASHESNIPFLSIPTAASHDGIVSGRASISVDGKRKSLTAQTPLAVVADTNIIAQSPYRLLAAGCGDVVANITAVMDWKLAQRLKNEEFSSSASMLADLTGRFMLDNSDMIKPGIEDSAWYVAKALVSSGVAMSIAGSSRPASGSEHKFSHALDEIAEKPALHGEQCGVGAIMMMYLHGGDWMKIREALINIGAPTTAKRLGVGDDEVVRALTYAHKISPDRYTILGDNGLSHEAAENLARITQVI